MPFLCPLAITGNFCSRWAWRMLTAVTVLCASVCVCVSMWWMGKKIPVPGVWMLCHFWEHWKVKSGDRWATVIREEGAKLFIAVGAALVPLSKCKLFLKDNSEIIHPGIFLKSRERRFQITSGEAWQSKRSTWAEEQIMPSRAELQQQLLRR